MPNHNLYSGYGRGKASKMKLSLTILILFTRVLINAQAVSQRCGEDVKVKHYNNATQSNFIGGDSAFNLYVLSAINRSILSSAKGKEIRISVLVITDSVGNTLDCKAFPKDEQDVFSKEARRVVSSIRSGATAKGQIAQVT